MSLHDRSLHASESLTDDADAAEMLYLAYANLNEVADIDEFTLASFLAGTLPAAQRRAVTRQLAAQPDALDLLLMAHEALEAASMLDDVAPAATAAAERAAA